MVFTLKSILIYVYIYIHSILLSHCHLPHICITAQFTTGLFFLLESLEHVLVINTIITCYLNNICCCRCWCAGRYSVCSGWPRWASCQEECGGVQSWDQQMDPCGRYGFLQAERRFWYYNFIGFASLTLFIFIQIHQNHLCLDLIEPGLLPMNNKSR